MSTSVRVFSLQKEPKKKKGVLERFKGESCDNGNETAGDEGICCGTEG